VDDFHFFIRHTSSMFQMRSGRKQFVVTCKRCHSYVSTGLKEFSFQSIFVTCPLCGDSRRYLPSETILGTPHPPPGGSAGAV